MPWSRGSRQAKYHSGINSQKSNRFLLAFSFSLCYYSFPVWVSAFPSRVPPCSAASRPAHHSHWDCRWSSSRWRRCRPRWPFITNWRRPTTMGTSIPTTTSANGFSTTRVIPSRGTSLPPAPCFIRSRRNFIHKASAVLSRVLIRFLPALLRPPEHGPIYRPSCHAAGLSGRISPLGFR